MIVDATFTRFYAGSALSNLADGVGRTALPLLAASLTRNPVLVSSLVTFAFLPWLLFALPSGVLIDRMDRRHAMAAANVVRAASMATLAVLVGTHTAGILLLYVVAFALGVAETVYDSASRAILPGLVGTMDLERANGLLTIEETLGQVFLGAPLGSALFAVAIALPLLGTAGGFAVAALVVLTVRGAFRPARPAEPTPLRREMSAGVRWLAGHKLLRVLTLNSALTSFAETLANSVLVLYVLDVLRLPPGDFGLVLLGAGVGGVLGGLAAPRFLRRFGRAATLLGGALLTASGTFAMGWTRNGCIGAVLFAFVAFGVMQWNVITMSLRQSLVPAELFGRVQGAYRTVVWGTIPLGAVAGGALAKMFGIAPVFRIAGVVLLLGAVWLAVIVRAHAEVLRNPSTGAVPDDESSALLR